MIAESAIAVPMRTSFQTLIKSSRVPSTPSEHAKNANQYLSEPNASEIESRKDWNVNVEEIAYWSEILRVLYCCLVRASQASCLFPKACAFEMQLIATFGAQGAYSVFFRLDLGCIEASSCEQKFFQKDAWDCSELVDKANTNFVTFHHFSTVDSFSP